MLLALSLLGAGRLAAFARIFCCADLIRITGMRECHRRFALVVNRVPCTQVLRARRAASARCCSGGQWRQWASRRHVRFTRRAAPEKVRTSFVICSVFFSYPCSVRCRPAIPSTRSDRMRCTCCGPHPSTLPPKRRLCGESAGAARVIRGGASTGPDGGVGDREASGGGGPPTKEGQGKAILQLHPSSVRLSLSSPGIHSPLRGCR